MRLEEYWGYILIVPSGKYRSGSEVYEDDLDGVFGCVINGTIASFDTDIRTALHLALPPFLPLKTWHVPMVAEEDFPEGEEDDDDEEGSVVVIEGREGFVNGLELARILGEILET